MTRVIGTVTITKDIERRRTYETASWYMDFAVSGGQTVELLAHSDHFTATGFAHFGAAAEGVCTGSLFVNRLGAHSSSKQDEEVGKRDRIGVYSATYFYSVVAAADAGERNGVLIELDEEAIGAELIAQARAFNARVAASQAQRKAAEANGCGIYRIEDGRRQHVVSQQAGKVRRVVDASGEAREGLIEGVEYVIDDGLSYVVTMESGEAVRVI